MEIKKRSEVIRLILNPDGVAGVARGCQTARGGDFCVSFFVFFWGFHRLIALPVLRGGSPKGKRPTIPERSGSPFSSPI